MDQYMECKGMKQEVAKVPGKQERRKTRKAIKTKIACSAGFEKCSTGLKSS